MYAHSVARVARVITLRHTWMDYKLCRNLKPTTQADYEKRINMYLSDWLDRPIASITKDDIEERHGSIKGEAQANLVMRIFKAIFNFARCKYDELDKAINPVRRLSEIRAWNRIKRRKSVISPADMEAWFKAVYGLHNGVVRDYLLFTIATGLRKNESAMLKWADVDFKNKTVTVLDTKNHEDHVLPMSDLVCEVLLRRSNRMKPGPYVFPGRKKGTHLTDFRHSHARVMKVSGVRFTIHDLRRSFTTTADSLDIPLHVIKMLVNHKRKDVSEGYICPSIERLRIPMQKISAELLRQANREL